MFLKRPPNILGFIAISVFSLPVADGLVQLVKQRSISLNKLKSWQKHTNKRLAGVNHTLNYLERDQRLSSALYGSKKKDFPPSMLDRMNPH